MFIYSSTLYTIFNQNRNKNRNMNEKQKGKMLKVHYFYIRGQCQPIRNLLYYLDVPFEDIMHEKTPQNSIDASFNLGFPMIQDQDVKVHDSIAILNYLCRKFNRLDLLGLTPQSFAKIQEVIIRYSLQKKKIISGIYDMIKFLSISGQGEREKGLRDRFRKMLSDCKFLDYCLKTTTLNKTFVSQSLTLIDFLYYEICFYLQGFFNDQLKKHTYFKQILEFKKKFEKLPFFKKNLNKFQEKYIFFQFDDIEMNKKIEKYWKGSTRCLKSVKKQL